MNDNKWGKPPIDFKGNNPAALGSCSAAAHSASNWIVAIDAWDYCDPSILAEMLQRHPIPFELQPIIADIVTGKRKQKKKAATKLKIPAGHRLIAAGIYATLKQDVIDATLQRKTSHDYHDIADEKGIEVSDYRRDLQAVGQKFKNEWSENAGVSTETLENLYEELRRKLKKYPNI